MPRLSLTTSVLFSSAGCEAHQTKVVWLERSRWLPVNLFAAVMGLSGLVLGWRFAHTAFGVARVDPDAIGLFSTIVFVVLAIGYGAKLLRHTASVKAEFNHPIAGNFFDTIAIALLLQSAVLDDYDSALGNVVW